MIEPFMLRRLKKDVLQELPEKEYVESFLELDQWQKLQYDRAMKAAREEIQTILDEKQHSQVKLHIFTLLRRLQQLCNFAEGQLESPKTKLLLELLETIAATQKKVLVFSQFLSEGTDKIASLLTEKKINYVLYTGQTTPQEKERAISNFRRSPEITVFLATTQTAGYGLTLTEATYVIHFDNLWNPAKMQNAEDRVHRIGQGKGVTIYSFWMRNTIETRIKQKLIEKCALIDKTINILAANLNDSDLSTDDWLDIFDIKLRKTIDREKSDQRLEARRLAAKSKSQGNQSKLFTHAASPQIIHELEQIKKLIETKADYSQRVFVIHGNYVDNSVKELILMSEKPPVFNQQGATIGVNYAASGSKQEFAQNVVAADQDFEVLLTDFEGFVNDLQQKYPDATNETAIQIIDVEAKEIQRTQSVRWQNFLNLKRLWNGGKKAAFKVGEHYAEQNPFGKGAIAFLEGVMEEKSK